MVLRAWELALNLGGERSVLAVLRKSIYNVPYLMKIIIYDKIELLNFSIWQVIMQTKGRFELESWVCLRLIKHNLY